MAERFVSTAMLTLGGLAFIGAAGFAFMSADQPGGGKRQSLDVPADPIGSRRAAPRSTPVLAALTEAPSRSSSGQGFVCSPLSVTDGDTIRCGSERVRLIGIDAPEMAGHCRIGRTCAPGDPFESKAALDTLTAGKNVTCERSGIDRYGRTLASCSNGTVNLSCALVARGAAIVRYGGFPC